MVLALIGVLSNVAKGGGAEIHALYCEGSSKLRAIAGAAQLIAILNIQLLAYCLSTQPSVTTLITQGEQSRLSYVPMPSSLCSYLASRLL
jgi:hypothetical protein